MLDNRKKAFAIKILVGPEDELDKTDGVQKVLSEEDSAPMLPEVDEDKAMEEELMGGDEENIAKKVAGDKKPLSLREGVRMGMLRKKGLNKEE